MKEGDLILSTRTLHEYLFSLAVHRPRDTEKIQYKLLGATLGKENFNAFVKELQRYTEGELNVAVLSRCVVEQSYIDGNKYWELSVNHTCSLPVAGKQLPILERYAQECFSMSLEGFVDTVNFILNDSRLYHNER